jgi:hypothetical protein
VTGLRTGKRATQTHTPTPTTRGRLERIVRCQLDIEKRPRKTKHGERGKEDERES